MACLTVTLAGEPMARAITVNCVSPGGIETAADGDPDPPKERYRDPSSTGPGVAGSWEDRGQRGISVGRLSPPTEVASAVVFFGAPEASFATGQRVGGGVAMV